MLVPFRSDVLLANIAHHRAALHAHHFVAAIFLDYFDLAFWIRAGPDKSLTHGLLNFLPRWCFLVIGLLAGFRNVRF